MEKTSSGYEPQNWRRQQPMARKIDYNREWGNAQSRQRSNGVLYARRRRDQFTTLLAIILIGFLGISLCGLGWAGVQGWRSAEARRASAQGLKINQKDAAPATVQIPAKKAKKTNILLLGSDQREGDGGFRTDVILLVSIDPDEKTVGVASFPRDMWVEPRPNDGMKINSVLALFGFETMANMFQTSFGVKPDYYVLTNFAGFTGIIDRLGGVDVKVGQSLTDDCDLPQQVDGDCTVDPGVLHMNGPTALWYVRSRHTSSDFDRMRRMQEVMEGIFDRLMSVNALVKIPDLYKDFSNNVETNLGLADILPFVPVASEVFNSPDQITRIAFGEDYGTEMLSWNGQWILLPDLEAIQAKLKEIGIN